MNEIEIFKVWLKQAYAWSGFRCTCKLLAKHWSLMMQISTALNFLTLARALVPGKPIQPSPNVIKVFTTLIHEYFRCSTLGQAISLTYIDSAGKACQGQAIWLISNFYELQLYFL